MAGGGVIPGTLIGGAIALGLIGFSWWFGGILDAKDEAFGDIPNLPGELAAGKSKPGGVGIKADRQNGSLAHTQTSPSIAPTEQERH